MTRALEPALRCVVALDTDDGLDAGIFGGVVKLHHAKHGAMVDAPAVIGLDVAMGIEVHERQRSVLLRMDPEKRIGDVVVATQRDHFRAG